MASERDRGREVLPIPDRRYVGLTTYDAKDPASSYPPIRPLRPPAGAPNVLVVLLDDVGFGASATFGGPCETPTFDRLAARGLRYTRFHTTALCAPTRAALLTGRNHHSVGFGVVTEMATSAPGYNSLRPNTAAPLAEVLKLNGYSTAQFGKCHEVPVWESSPIGPFDAWPAGGGGFEYFYGFIGADAHQYYPPLTDGLTAVEPDKTPDKGYHLTDDMTTKAINWVRQQKALAPDKPFFAYYAPGATHAPHHVPKDWADRYKGRFDQGWDRLREEIFARQQKLGVVPADAELTPRPAEIPAWDDMPDELKPVLVRQMEVYAGFLEHTDHHVGRLVAALEELGVLDDTLVIAMIGDNGPSAEGTLNGTFDELLGPNGFSALETPEYLLSVMDSLGGPEGYNHYAVGWAHAMSTPYQWTKQIASHWGGTRNGTIVHWPNGFEPRGEIRHQFHHVIDVAPTVLEAAGIPEPLFVNGVQQQPIEGVSMLYSFGEADAPDRHTTQYFEMLGNRGIYHNGWTAVTKHRTPWAFTGAVPAFDDDVWELYDTTTDWTQVRDLSGEMPDRLHELQRLWLIEAAKHNVLPLDDRLIERFNADMAGRPQLVQGTSQLLFSGMGRLSENIALNIKNKSHSVTAELVVPEGVAQGVIIAQGGSSGGWSLYAHGGRLKYCYNLVRRQHFFVESAEAIPEGTHQVRMEFAYDGGGIAKGGTVTLYIDGERQGDGRVEQTIPFVFSLDEGVDVGREHGTTVSPDYPIGDNAFNGELNWVQIDIGVDDHDHLISPEERLNLAMVRQ
jgi:arylsulfatase